MDEHYTREGILAQNSPSNESTIDVKNILQPEFDITLETIRNNLSTRNVSRKLCDVKQYQSGSRVLLPSVRSKDTDPNLAFQILSQEQVKNLVKKTMGIAMRLKKQYENFNQIYATPTFPKIFDSRKTYAI